MHRHAIDLALCEKSNCPYQNLVLHKLYTCSTVLLSWCKCEIKYIFMCALTSDQIQNDKKLQVISYPNMLDIMLVQLTIFTT